MGPPNYDEKERAKLRSKTAAKSAPSVGVSDQRLQNQLSASADYHKLLAYNGQGHVVDQIKLATKRIGRGCLEVNLVASTPRSFQFTNIGGI